MVIICENGYQTSYIILDRRIRMRGWIIDNFLIILFCIYGSVFLLSFLVFSELENVK